MFPLFILMPNCRSAWSTLLSVYRLDVGRCRSEDEIINDAGELGATLYHRHILSNPADRLTPHSSGTIVQHTPRFTG